MTHPPTVRIERDMDVDHSYLWLKTVTAVNLSVHCFHALVGRALPVLQDAQDQWLELPEAPAYYLCGVTKPYRWEQNSHVLMLPDPAATEPLSVTTPALYVTMWGLRVVDITDDDLDPEPYGHRKNYTTCRNLQAAWLLHQRHRFGNEPERAQALQLRQRASAGPAQPPQDPQLF